LHASYAAFAAVMSRDGRRLFERLQSELKKPFE
jgi:hypothetical protein